MKLGPGTSYWPIIRQSERAISQDIGRVSHLKPITKTKTTHRGDKNGKNI
jgi:hypothetical protein